MPPVRKGHAHAQAICKIRSMVLVQSRFPRDSSDGRKEVGLGLCNSI